MHNPEYLRLKNKAVQEAERIGEPSFYIDCRDELMKAREAFSKNSTLRRCFSYLDEKLMGAGHGLAHSEAVALDAGAIVQIEGKIDNIDNDFIEELVIYAEIAGILHDIRRKERDHTISGSIEAKKILKNFHIGNSFKDYIAAAIRNHEAFREVIASENETAKLISDSLYDADKFRWGPDNFTKTIWLMLESNNISIEELNRRFNENMSYIAKIKKTFRTRTGKKYGPEFIDKGITIGNAIYKEMGKILGKARSK